jgi:O-antigen ligase
VPESFFGLPLHPLVVHATVVAIPAAATLLVLSAFVPRFRRWAGILTPLAAISALVLVPITTSTGAELREQVEDNPLIAEHVALASNVLPWVVGLAVVAVAVYLFEWRNRRYGREARASRPLAAVLAVLALVVSTGATVQVALAGHAGSKAAWTSVEQEDEGSNSGSGSDDSGSDDSGSDDSGSDDSGSGS